ncbi:hypothetical protein ACOME3_007740 [Neoechinorhynchus agilis]
MRASILSIQSPRILLIVRSPTQLLVSFCCIMKPKRNNLGDPESKQKILSRTFCGSTAYAPPEVLRNVPYNPKMMDIWSLGIILFVMASIIDPQIQSDSKI